jgi:hypothetical protein
MIRHYKPRRIIEIGSGYSTRCAASAIVRNRQIDPQYECELIAIEPYPDNVLKTGFPGFTRLIPLNLQEVPLSDFEKLQKNDILFIDSSHVLKIGSDVQYEYLELLPRLSSGVLVHLHDIFLPREYPKRWVIQQHKFWNEQYLLQAFLSFNSGFETVWAGGYIHNKYPEKIIEAFSFRNTNSESPGSYWIRRL